MLCFKGKFLSIEEEGKGKSHCDHFDEEIVLEEIMYKEVGGGKGCCGMECNLTGGAVDSVGNFRELLDLIPVL